jgi:hypothetical protein
MSWASKFRSGMTLPHRHLLGNEVDELEIVDMPTDRGCSTIVIRIFPDVSGAKSMRPLLRDRV